MTKRKVIFSNKMSKNELVEKAKNMMTEESIVFSVNEDRFPRHIYFNVCCPECMTKRIMPGGNIPRQKSTRCQKCPPPERIIHGRSKEPIYAVYRAMKQRCNNEKNRAYKWYGKRGIKLCKSWETEPKAFMDWALNNGYGPNMTIDRINVNKGYEPSNCRWITKKENTEYRNLEKSKLSPEEKKTLLDSYQNNSTTKDLMMEYNISENSIKSIIQTAKNNGLKILDQRTLRKYSNREEV